MGPARAPARRRLPFRSLPLPLPLLLLLLLLQVSAEAANKCTHEAAGDLVGTHLYLNNTLLTPTAHRDYTYAVPKLPGCELNGVHARACDLFAPEVEVSRELTEVRVRRLGPRVRPLQLQLALYCDPARPSPPPLHH